MNVPEIDGRLLRLLAEATGAKSVVELGTSSGYSGIWFCLALRQTGGKLTTFDLSQERLALARKNFERAGVTELVKIVEGDAHETIKTVEGPVDLVFIDADKEGYVDYLEKILPKVRPGGIIVAHNINPRMADARYMKAITENPQLETLFPNLEGTGGVSVSMKKR
jgi:predicted O-methyltransferase YrrM